MATVTINQIAERLGLHQSTVSRILNGHRKEIDAKVAARAAQVRQVAEEMGYRPNFAARATRQGRTNVLALLLSSAESTSYLPWGLLQGLHTTAASRGLQLRLSQFPDDRLSDESFMKQALAQLSADGLLVDYTHQMPQRMIEVIRRHQIPAIWINTKQPTDCVHPDDLDAGRRATRVLLEAGHRRIAYVDYQWGPQSTKPFHYSIADRQAGYEQAMREAGLAARVYRESSYVPVEQRTALAARWLADKGRPTAILAYSSNDVQAALIAALRMGLECPRDLSVVTFGYNVSWFDRVAMTMMREPQETLGAKAVEALVGKTLRPSESVAPVAVEFAVRQSGSVAPPRE